MARETHSLQLKPNGPILLFPKSFPVRWPNDYISARQR